MISFSLDLFVFVIIFTIIASRHHHHHATMITEWFALNLLRWMRRLYETVGELDAASPPSPTSIIIIGRVMAAMAAADVLSDLSILVPRR